MSFDCGQSDRGSYVGVAATNVDVDVGSDVVCVAFELRIVSISDRWNVCDPSTMGVGFRTHFTSFMFVGVTLLSCMFLPPTAPPTTAPTITRAITAATIKNVFTFIPKMMRGGRLSLTKACLPVYRIVLAASYAGASLTTGNLSLTG